VEIALSVMYWPWFEPAEQLDMAVAADRAGFASVWVAEGYGQDAIALLGWMAGRTERIGLGAGVLQIPARQPTTTAMAAASVDRISGGRFLLGLGLSGPLVSEGFYGVPFTAPLTRTREYIEIVRLALSGAPVGYVGEHWQLPVRDGAAGARALKLLGGPPRPNLPIYLGVGGERTVLQCGELADGWMPFLFSPRYASMLTAPLLEGIAGAGRSPADVTVAPMVPAALNRDLDGARDALRPVLAMYLGAMGSRDHNFYVDLAERYGEGTAARACQAAFLAGDKRAAASALTPTLIDLVAMAATPRTLESRLADYRDAGVDTLVVAPFGDRQALLAALSAHLPEASQERRTP